MIRGANDLLDPTRYFSTRTDGSRSRAAWIGFASTLLLAQSHEVDLRAADPPAVLSTLRSEHPRLLFTRDIEQSVRAAAEDDPVPLGLVRQSRSWTRRDNSWNEVCDSGMLLGALAIVEHEPELASQVIDAARDSLPHGLSAYQPDGAYPEGRSYWEYGAMYTCLAIQGLTTAH